MKISRCDFDWELKSASGQKMGEGRSPGIHLSDVLRFMEAQEQEIDYVNDPPDVSNPLVKTRLSMGFIWERFYEVVRDYMGMARGVGAQQNELCVDGIYLTPDEYDPTTRTVIELKATWKSQRKAGEDGEGLSVNFPRWIAQIKAYCYCLKTTKAKLAVFWVNRSYKWDKEPEGMSPWQAYAIEFTQQELDEHWRAILNNRAALEKYLKYKKGLQNGGS